MLKRFSSINFFYSRYVVDNRKWKTDAEEARIYSESSAASAIMVELHGNQL